MNLLKQEWKSSIKATLCWAIGIFALLTLAFYEMQGLSTMPGGIDAFLKTMPSFLQQIFGMSGNDNTALSVYRMIHMYMLIALALHAVLLGAGIFAKEERDRTYEFLYVKGVTRFKIMSIKIMSGIGILLLLNIVCLLGVFISSSMAGMEFSFLDILPYIGALFMTQLFFFSLALLLSLLPVISHKSSSIGCGIVFLMFLITMYVKMGNQMAWLDSFSIFHYADASFIKEDPTFSLSWILILLIALGGFLCSQYLHEHRDLL